MKIERHGHGAPGKRTRTYRSWQAMKARCYDHKNNRFHCYGGRGIEVCQRWKYSFVDFLKDMGECPENYSLNRIDNDGHYTPQNCEWTDNLTQSNNRFNNVFYSNNETGETLTESQWSVLLGGKPGAVNARINKMGWSIQDAITNPILENEKMITNLQTGEVFNMSQWSIKLGGMRQLVLQRIRRGWNEQDAITIPSGSRRKNK